MRTSGGFMGETDPYLSANLQAHMMYGGPFAQASAQEASAKLAAEASKVNLVVVLPETVTGVPPLDAMA